MPGWPYLLMDCLGLLKARAAILIDGMQDKHIVRTARFVCSSLQFIPHEPRKKDPHSLYLQCFHQRSLRKFSENSNKCKFLLFTDTLNLIACKITAGVIWPTSELLYDCVHWELNRKFSHGSMKEM